MQDKSASNGEKIFQNFFTGQELIIGQNISKKPSCPTIAISLIRNLEVLGDFLKEHEASGFSVGNIGLGCAVLGVKVNSDGFIEPKVTKEHHSPATFTCEGPIRWLWFEGELSMLYPDIPLNRLKIGLLPRCVGEHFIFQVYYSEY